MPPTPDDPLQSPQHSDSEAATNTLRNPKHRPRHAKSPLGSVSTLPYRRSNASLSALFQSTSSLPTLHPTVSPTESGAGTPTAGPGAGGNGSVFSPGGSTRAGSPSLGGGNVREMSGETKDVILQAFAPHVSVLASQDTEELMRHKGISGGLLELLRPFGEHVSGKVTVRESSGASRSYDDFAVRFVGVKDGLESPRSAGRESMESATGQAQNGHSRLPSSLEFKPARLRSGGDVPQVEELVERHLTFAEEQSWPIEDDYLTHKEREPTRDPSADSPFYLLYLRRLLSGLPLVPSETFSHPVATVIAISSRSKSPIEDLRTLYASSNTGDHRLPPWVLNEFLRYYVLIHDEDYDDITTSLTLYDQMKRHFGLHCHLLRLRSTPALPSSPDTLKLPHPQWTSSAEELAEITSRETSDHDTDPTPFIFDSDATALHAFVRELLTQSVLPAMERSAAQWNDQVAARRRGLTGRFMSISKRLTVFGNRSATGPSLGGGGSNYDPQTGIYPAAAPEALMRKLADHALMLRDYKLAQTTYELLCQDFKADKAWRYYAAANEMAAVSTLLAAAGGKIRLEALEGYLEAAYYSYVTRVGAPYYALRTLVLGVECLKLRGGNGVALDAGARWLGRIVQDRLVGAVGHALVVERIGLVYGERQREGRGGGVVGVDQTGERGRKAAFFFVLAAEAWLGLEKVDQAEFCLGRAGGLYGDVGGWEGVEGYLGVLRGRVEEARAGPLVGGVGEGVEVEVLQDDGEQLGLGVVPPGVARGHGHRKSLSAVAALQMPGSATQGGFDPLGVAPSGYEGGGDGVLEPRSPGLERTRDDGFQ